MHAQSLNLEIEPAKKGVICNLIVFFQNQNGEFVLWHNIRLQQKGVW
ncbi:hypothetical protein H500_05685 [Helicobacter pylori CG-IMSS-2012]|nr:hypothetical protein H500_05685 [Helicobacter pylori CG-IMSS-2012]